MCFIHLLVVSLSPWDFLAGSSIPNRMSLKPSGQCLVLSRQAPVPPLHQRGRYLHGAAFHFNACVQITTKMENGNSATGIHIWTITYSTVDILNNS